jgi:Rrf2 family protein
MLLPQTAEYALRAVLHIASVDQDRSVRVDETAEALGIPRNYLSKTLHQLVRAGILTSARGPLGGFRLATAADELTLARIISPFVVSTERRCLLGQGICGESPACAMHERWGPIAVQMRDFFGETTVADLLVVSPSTLS